MYKKKMEMDIRSPLEYGLSLICGKWKSRIICLIWYNESMRFGEIKAELLDISDGVLASTLNELIAANMVIKHGDDSESKKHQTSYSLTDKAKSVIPLLVELCRWSSEYYEYNSENIISYCKNCELYKEWEKGNK